jgi:hypothetical protein
MLVKIKRGIRATQVAYLLDTFSNMKMEKSIDTNICNQKQLSYQPKTTVFKYNKVSNKQNCNLKNKLNGLFFKFFKFD